MLMINAVTVTSKQASIWIKTRTENVEVIVDPQDEEKASQLKRIVLYKDPKGRRMGRSDKSDGQVLLHRYLFDIPPGHKLEWINGNTLDLRRENLLLVDVKTGQTTPLYTPEIRQTSEVRGVYFHKASSRWHASAFYGKKRYSLGYFEDQQGAIDEINIFRTEGPNSPKLKRNQRRN